ncbi:Transglutaminase-like [Rhabdaerophilaceae bacterium]
MPNLTIIMSDPVPPGAPLLLAPRLVDAFGFRQADMNVEHGEILGETTATNGGQSAYLIRPTATPLRPVLKYTMEGSDVAPPGWIWQQPDTRYMKPSEPFAAYFRECVAGAASQTEALERIVAHASEVFWYGHGSGSLMDGRDCVPLLTGPTRGHCVDMHGYCVAACRVVGLDAAYCAGFWFKDGSFRAPGMHCWFVAKVDGQIVHYDVSHHLKLPLLPVRPGLNPIPGIRFLAAVGKGLTFNTPNGAVQASHFARLIWVTDDGLDHYPAHEIVLDTGNPGLVKASAPQLEPSC